MLYDFYKILEISRSASMEDIKKAYRLKAKLVHPDINNSPKANEVFAIVSEAYETLTDEKTRYLYDIKLDKIETEKATAERKKQYYGSSIKNDSYPNGIHPNYQSEWSSLNNYIYKEKTDEHYYKKSPWLYNLFFACGILIGFIIIIVMIVGTIRNYWPSPFVLISISGIILVREGWKGIMGKKNFLSKVFKVFRK
ncbi:MAG: DnaJ domain-containing protein [Bacteroidetes bacterium]|nr:DnaJ domain-containing protein [Bacteroidota bacterium]